MMQRIKPKTIDDLKSFIAASPETEKFLNGMMKPTPEEIIRSIAGAAGSASAVSDPGRTLAEIRRLSEDYLKSNPAAKAIKSFVEGPDEWDVAAKIEEAQGDHDSVDSIQAMGSCGVFDIDICKAGPLYFTWAPEFGRIEWFTSVEDARAHAFEEYSEYIAQYEESLEEEDEDEEEDSESDGSKRP